MADKMKVLVVDDDESVRRLCRRILQRAEGFELVGEASGGQEAIDLVPQLLPDVIVMDIEMPGMSGVEATRALKQSHPDIPVLAHTGMGDIDSVSDMIKAGAAGYVVKGSSAEDFTASLRALSRGSGVLDEKVTGPVLERMAELLHAEQERAEALADLNRMKTEFVAVVSHELRTPLTSIIGVSQLLRRRIDKLDPETRTEFLTTVEEQAKKLNRLVGHLLTVSGLQRGAIGFEPQDFSLNEVAHESAMAAIEATKQETSRLKLSSPGDVRARGDLERVRDAATGVIENALRFTDGEVHVVVSTSPDEVRLAVSDAGPGMTQELASRLGTEPFRQGDSSPTREVGGLGLSLYIAARVLEALGGHLEVVSDVDKGTTITLVLLPPGR
jgi:signal transduction histidine kinase